MALKSLTHYLFRVIRIFADLLTDFIGIIYFSNKDYLPELTDRLLLEPAINLAQRIRTGQVYYALKVFLSVLKNRFFIEKIRKQF